MEGNVSAQEDRSAPAGLNRKLPLRTNPEQKRPACLYGAAKRCVILNGQYHAGTESGRRMPASDETGEILYADDF